MTYEAWRAAGEAAAEPGWARRYGERVKRRRLSTGVNYAVFAARVLDRLRQLGRRLRSWWNRPPVARGRPLVRPPRAPGHRRPNRPPRPHHPSTAPGWTGAAAEATLEVSLVMAGLAAIVGSLMLWALFVLWS